MSMMHLKMFKVYVIMTSCWFQEQLTRCQLMSSFIRDVLIRGGLIRFCITRGMLIWNYLINDGLTRGVLITHKEVSQKGWSHEGDLVRYVFKFCQAFNFNQYMV